MRGTAGASLRQDGPMVPPGTSWVLFEHGTCVLLKEPEGDLAE